MIDKRTGAVAAVYGYEAVALCSDGRLPTISALCEQHRWLSLVAIAALVVHLRPWLIVIVVPEEGRGLRPV